MLNLLLDLVLKLLKMNQNISNFECLALSFNHFCSLILNRPVYQFVFKIVQREQY